MRELHRKGSCFRSCIGSTTDSNLEGA